MFRFLAPVFAILLPLAATACPDPVETTVSPRIIDTMMQWIDEKTAYDMTGITPPRIRFCARNAALAQVGDTVLVDPALAAAYDPATQTVYMTAPWSPIDPETTSILLHQLIHHVQMQAQDWPCPAATQFEAYWLQDHWLGEQGYGTGFDWTQILVDSRCPVETRQ